MAILKKRPVAKKDEANFRFIISPIPEEGIGIGKALRAVKASGMTWRVIAQFCGLADQSEAFRCACVSRTFPAKRALSEYLTVKNGVAYLYDKDHKPEQAAKVHVPVTIKNTADKQFITITQRVPSKVAAHISLNDPLNRILTMHVTPTNGYIIGMGGLNLCDPNVTFVTRGTAKTLNAVLRQIHFVGWEKGEGRLEVVVNDGSKDTSKAVQTTSINLFVNEGKTISIPEIVLPEAVKIKAGEDSKIPAIKITDADGKLMEMRVAPFGCEVFGFKNFLHVISEGETRVVTGAPDMLSAEVANLVVRTPADATRAALGIELVYGKTIIRKYLMLAFETQEPEPPTEPEAQAVVGEGVVGKATI